MSLTENQIQELYKFTRQHYVEYFDVQTELVDHLANDIEKLCKENPKLSFEQARDTSFKKFGVFGFMEVVELKQKQLNKTYRKLIWQFMKDWFTFPKIISTAFIFYLFYTLISLNISKGYLEGFMLILALIDLVFAFKLSKKAKIRFEKNKHKFLLEDIIFKTGAFSGIIIFMNFFHLTRFFAETTSILGKSIFASLLTVAIIYSYVSLIVIPKKAEELLQEIYPEYKMI
jgi:hypothetical protein